MFYLKNRLLESKSGTIIFLSLLVLFVVVSPRSVKALSESECVNTNKGSCVSESKCDTTTSTSHGACDDKSGTICCEAGTLSKTACEAYSGSCKSESCDTSSYTYTGKCLASDGGGFCCVPNGATSDSSCSCGGKAGTCAKPGTTCSSLGDYKAYGVCSESKLLSAAQACCIPSSCDATPSTTVSSGSLSYTPLENLPGFEGQSGDFATYFGNLYKLALWIVAISALFMAIVGGFLYLSSAGNTSTLGTAKKTIVSALVGLVIALISWLLLDTINGDLTNLKLTGLTGSIGSGTGTTAGATATAGTGSGGSTTSGTYTHAEAVAALSAAGIGVTSTKAGCLGVDAVDCTTLEQIPKAAIDDLISIKKDCGCSFNVTGGTETTGHVSHGPGKPVVDVTQDTTLGNFLYSKAGGSNGKTITSSPGYGISKICVTTTWENKLNYNCGSYREKRAHFHLVF